MSISDLAHWGRSVMGQLPQCLPRRATTQSMVAATVTTLKSTRATISAARQVIGDRFKPNLQQLLEPPSISSTAQSP